MTFDELNKLENEIAANTESARLKQGQELNAALAKANADYVAGMQKIFDEADARRADIIKKFDALLKAERDAADKRLKDELGANEKAKAAPVRAQAAKK